jgi:serine/threonine-protein kinase RsbT
MEIIIYINNDLDVAMARMQARQMAKRMGFTATDQARISLATSELARMLVWQAQDSAKMICSMTQKDSYAGFQIVCQLDLRQNPGSDPVELNIQDKLSHVRHLMDEEALEYQEDHYTRVTLIKWLR